MSQLTYNIDLVICIDVTGSMAPVMNVVKENTRRLAEDLQNKLEEKDKHPTTIRARVVAFGDLAVDPSPIRASDFFTLLPSNQTAEFERFVRELTPSGGGDIPESGLEALSIALSSDWTQDGNKQRHVVVMFTDAPAHRLEDRVGTVPPEFAASVPSSLNELTDGWESEQGGFARLLKNTARRLVIFAPDDYPWPTVGDNWSQTVFFPSKAGEGLRDLEYGQILEVLANSI